MTIGDRIKYRRIELNMSQVELAKRLGFKSRSSINKIELDQRNLTQSRIKAIAVALDTTPSYIMGWDEEYEPITGEDDELVADIIRLFAGLSPEHRQEALNYLQYLSKKEDSS